MDQTVGPQRECRGGWGKRGEINQRMWVHIYEPNQWSRTIGGGGMSEGGLEWGVEDKYVIP